MLKHAGLPAWQLIGQPDKASSGCCIPAANSRKIISCSMVIAMMAA
jgi:hypothetical protein